MKQLSDFDFIFLGQDFNEELRSLGPIRWVFINSDQEFQVQLQHVKKRGFCCDSDADFYIQTFKVLRSSFAHLFKVSLYSYVSSSR
ncbi:hypothetical protein BDW_05575 [Bdellovibrio bacteriovorus W]|nr:hypothetical protein BDW_05575 [Bdellovibrio bacteriovorus W]